jgi:hypothetical protein
VPSKNDNDVPSELKEPIRLDLIFAEAARLERAGQKSRPFKILITEIRRRLVLMAQYLDRPWPQNADEWENLLTAICLKYEVPGFKVSVRGAGAKLGWPSWKYIELRLDVRLLKQKNRKWSDLAACKYIAGHPEKYNNRYPKNVNTLHRHFLRAKKANGNSDAEDIPESIAMLLDPNLDRDFLEARLRIHDKIVALISSDEKLRNEMRGLLTQKS